MIPILVTIAEYAVSLFWYLIKNPKVMFYGAIAITLAFVYFQLHLANNKISALELKNANLQTELQVLHVVEESKRQNDIILTQRIAKQEELSKDLEVAISEIDATPATEDGPVAPVLKRALEGKKK